MSSPPSLPAVRELRRRLEGLTLRDERRLRRRLDRARRHDDPGRRERALAAVANDLAAAEQRVTHRRASVPTPSYPPELPVSAARDELRRALEASQVVVVAGETGSGKTTQLPKLCLELGRGVRGQIGHTQPRRIAARTVAERIAAELGVELGAQVGYQIRFADRSRQDTLLKVMTDGILLAEIQRDPALRAYDTIILDEAHERSLNIDFLLGYLKQLLPRRPDLQLVITSATIDVERLSRHLDDAPIVEVSGRTYPVEVRYNPLEGGAGEDDDQTTAICGAVKELIGEGPGDVLVFLPGERDIRDAADALGELGLADTEILALYARLSAAEQQRVFAPHTGRRIVLATNVAETSLTVPGIRYVVDTGTARISRFNQRTKVQRLPIEKVSRASAEQRKGRCGRVAEGVCIRLYSEEDFEARPEFTDPEILRTNLASVILQMTALGLGDVAAFPFVDPPDQRSVREGEALLAELGAVTAIEEGRRLTPVGRALARLPVDPRLGRMIVEGHRNGCLAETLVITAALSIQDPRERPTEARDAADALHARFADERSDFLAYLELWSYLAEQQRALSSSALRRRCKAEYLHYPRVREWWDLHAQLRAVAEEEGMAVEGRAVGEIEPEAVDRSLLAGLLSQIGMRPSERREYQGARGTRFAIWPGSALAQRPPPWVMAAELVETSRLWARTVAGFEPAWAERLAGDLVERSYSEPRWDRRRGAAVAEEKVTLYGVPLASERTVPYNRVDPSHARELFIRHALVEGDWDAHHAFLDENRRRRAEVAELEDRARRRDLAVDDDTLVELFDRRLPDAVVSARHFERWWKEAARAQPELLTIDRELLLADAAELPTREDFPDVWHHAGVELALSYRFEPGAEDDGVTLEVPLALLHRLSTEAFDWQVPGLRGELVGELVRGLPKPLRRRLVPVPDVVSAVLPRLAPDRAPLPAVLSEEIRRHTGVDVPVAEWSLDALPAHLRMTFRVVDDGRVIAESKDLPALQRRLARRARDRVAESAAGIERSGQRRWAFGTVPRTVPIDHGGAVLTGWPALVDEGDAVGLRVLLSEDAQHRAMWQGTRRLLLLAHPPPVRAVHARLGEATKLALTRNPHGSVADLLADATACAIDALVAEHGGPAWDEEGFAKLRHAVATGLEEAVVDVLTRAERVLAAAGRARERIDSTPGEDLRPTREDADAHLARLVHDGFLTAAGRDRLDDLARYVEGIALRLDKAARAPRRDRDLLARVAEVQRAYADLLRRLGPRADGGAYEIGWMIEELRVSLFAQQLGTAHRVSEQRVVRAIDAAATA